MAEQKVDLDKPVLTYNQRQELEREIETLKTQSTDPEAGKGFRSGMGSLDRGLAKKNMRKAEQMLAEQAPDPNPSAETKDYLRTREREMAATLREGMPTQFEMRSNPPGAVAKHMAWEAGKKKLLLRWKNAKRRLEPDNSDPDLSSTEMLRDPGARWVAGEPYRAGYDQVEWKASKPEPLDPSPEIKHSCGCGAGFRLKSAFNAHQGICSGVATTQG